MKKYVQNFVAMVMITAFVFGGVSEFQNLDTFGSDNETIAEEAAEETNEEIAEEQEEEKEEDSEAFEPEEKEEESEDFEQEEEEETDLEDLDTEEELKADIPPQIEETPVMAANSAFSMDYSVSTFDELKQAIADAAGGDTIIIKNDIALEETLHMVKELYFKGENGMTVTLTAPAGESHISVDNIFFSILDIQFENIILDGNHNGGGINVRNTAIHGNNLQIINCTKSALTASDKVELRGDILFKGNDGSDAIRGGGAVFSANGSLEISGKVDFVENSASEGGAIFVHRSSVTISGEANFIDNTADMGGAVYLYLRGERDSFLYITGKANFTGNSGPAILNGGIVDISGEASFTRNASPTNGGAICQGNIIISGKASFIGNTAEEDGGAIYTGAFVPGDDLKISGEVEFIENTAQGNGGAVYIFRSIPSPSLSGKVNFIGNTAVKNGGAIYTSSDFLDISGETRFTENTAENGGAIYTDDLNNVTIGENVIFEDNRAATMAVNLTDGDILIHKANIKTDKFTHGLPYGYNNLDINYADAEGKAYLLVSFDTNGGTPVPENQFIESGAFTQEPTAPAKSGHSFEGWFTEQGELWDFDTKAVTEDMTLYAQWKTDNNNGGDNNNGNNGGNNSGGSDRDRDKDDKDSKTDNKKDSLKPETVPVYNPEPIIDIYEYTDTLQEESVIETWSQTEEAEEDTLIITEVEAVEEDTAKSNPKTTDTQYKILLLSAFIPLAVLIKVLHKRKNRLIYS